MSRYVVDGRFLLGRPTGLHRVARSLLDAALEAGLEAEVWAPRGADDPLVSRRFAVPRGRGVDRLWEQVVLPAAAGRRTVVSLTNTSPVVRPGVVMVHDLAVRVGPQWFAHSMRLYAATLLHGARRAGHVVTVSAAVRDELVAAGVARSRVTVIPPAVDPMFAPAPTATVDEARARFGLERPYLVLTGWADPRKDAVTAVAAHQRVVADVPHDLVLVGAEHPTFAPVALPHLTSVRRVGHVEDRWLVALLSGATALLYPSRYEGFGLPPLEAQACGTPAVAADIPALRESTAGTVRLEPVADVGAWAAAVRDALAGRLSCPSPPARSWQAAGRQLVAALRDGAAR